MVWGLTSTFSLRSRVTNVVFDGLGVVALSPENRRAKTGGASDLSRQSHALRSFVQADEVSQRTYSMKHHVDMPKRKVGTL